MLNVNSRQLKDCLTFLNHSRQIARKQCWLIRDSFSVGRSSHWDSPSVPSLHAHLYLWPIHFLCFLSQSQFPVASLPASPPPLHCSPLCWRHVCVRRLWMGLLPGPVTVDITNAELPAQWIQGDVPGDALIFCGLHFSSPVHEKADYVTSCVRWGTKLWIGDCWRKFSTQNETFMTWCWVTNSHDCLRIAYKHDFQQAYNWIPKVLWLNLWIYFN